MADEDQSDTIETASQKPKKFTSDGVSVEAHSIGDKIAAADRAAANRNAKKRHRGILFSRLQPGGPT